MAERIYGYDPEISQKLKEKIGKKVSVFVKNRYECYVKCTFGTVESVNGKVVILTERGRKKDVDIDEARMFSFEEEN